MTHHLAHGTLNGNKFLDNRQHEVSVSDYLDSITSNSKLKTVLNYLFLTYGTQPRDAPLWINSALWRHYMDGGYYPTGGSYAMTKALAEAGFHIDA